MTEQTTITAWLNRESNADRRAARGLGLLMQLEAQERQDNRKKERKGGLT